LMFGVPLFAFVILTAVFSHPVIRGLGVAVVDADRSETSRAFIEQVAASPSLRIVPRTGDLASAARAIRSGDAIAAVYIPADFERDLRAERRPQVVAFYNQQYLTAAGVASSGLSDTFAAEWRRVLSIPGAFILLVVGPIVYGFYYPQPYLNQILRKIPIAVVDNDLSELSRRIVETLDASGAVSVAVRAATLAEAHAAVDRGQALAVVGIPPQTERDVLKGNSVHIPIYADATYLFIFRTTASGIATAIATLSAELAAGGARTDGSLVKAALASTSPAEVLLQPIFNPVGGYASYIIPAAFVLILQQMLLIGASMLTVITMAQRPGGAFATVLGRGVAHLTIYLPALALYFIVLPRLYGLSTLGSPLQLFALAALFTLATSFMGQAAGAWFKHPETPTLIFLGTSLPQLFLAGFSWPREAIPESVQAAGYIFPSDFAIDGIVRVGQLGADLWEVVGDWRGLWLLTIIYFVLAVMSAFLAQQRRAHGRP
jgi:ABC-2 type transport system permease protein